MGKLDHLFILMTLYGTINLKGKIKNYNIEEKNKNLKFSFIDF